MTWDGDGYKAASVGELISEFVIWGQPKPKERPRRGKAGNFYTPKDTVNRETAVIDAFELAAPLWEPTIELVRLEVEAHFEKKVISDGDNIFKLVGDALNKHAYRDDKQVKQGAFEWFENAGDRARTVVRFYILGD